MNKIHITILTLLLSHRMYIILVFTEREEMCRFVLQTLET